jgi:hypothetical protein
MLSQQKPNPNIRNHTRTGDQAFFFFAMQGICMAKKRNAYRVSGRKAEGRKSFGRPNRRWEAIIKINLNYEGEAYRVYLALDKGMWRDFVNTVMNQHVI